MSKDIKKCLREVSKRLKLKSDKVLRNNLEYAVGDDVAEAYRLGAEEAHHTMIARIAALLPKPTEQTT